MLLFAKIFKNQDGILSGPDALFTSRLSNKFFIPSGLILMVSITGTGKLSMCGTELKSSLTNTEEK